MLTFSDGAHAGSLKDVQQKNREWTKIKSSRSTSIRIPKGCRPFMNRFVEIGLILLDSRGHARSRAWAARPRQHRGRVRYPIRNPDFRSIWFDSVNFTRWNRRRI